MGHGVPCDDKINTFLIDICLNEPLAFQLYTYNSSFLVSSYIKCFLLFSPSTVDSNPEYDDDTQIERDAEDDYFDDEEPGNEVQEDTTPNHNDSESEDELDAYMRQLENDSSGKAREESDKNQEKS